MSERSGVRRGRTVWWTGLFLLLVAAVATRFFRLTAWGLSGDEFFTLQDSLNPSLDPTNRPLLYWLNHFVVAPFLPLNELGLRILPALFGVAGVGAVAWLGRRISGVRAGLVAGALVVASPWHLQMSQFGRYYSLLFLIAVLAVGGLWLGVRENHRRWLAVGAAAVGVGSLAHPTLLLPVAGLLVWAAVWAVSVAERRTRNILLGGAAVIAVAGLAAAAALLDKWVGLGQTWGIGGIGVLFSYVQRVGTGPIVAAAGGVALLWFGERRWTAGFLATVVVVPVLLLAVLGEYVSVHTGYLFATAPFTLAAAAVFVDQLATRVSERSFRFTGTVTVTALVAVTGLPWFVSHYVDGGRPDYRGAARYLAEHASPGDVAVTDQAGTLKYHEPGPIEPLPLERKPARLDSLWREVGRREPPGTLWVLPYVRSRGGFSVQGLEEADGWVRTNCRQRERLGSVRIDHQRVWLPIWECPPGSGPAANERGTGD